DPAAHPAARAAGHQAGRPGPGAARRHPRQRARRHAGHPAGPAAAARHVPGPLALLHLRGRVMMQPPLLSSVRSLQFGPLRLASRSLLSPLAGYTNLPLRLAVRELGGLGLATTDLVNARALLRASPKTMEFVETRPEDYPLAVQIYGADPHEMSDAARWLEEY